MMFYEKPVFILSTSWRSGSTLLQRYITASGQVMVWGETGGALDALREALSGWEQITADSSRRFPGGIGGKGEASYRSFIAIPKEDHAKKWIANLTPPYGEIVMSVRSLLTELYGKRAEALGYPRFGIKETRCDLATARFLRTLFPDAKFVFLVREPLDVLLSIKRRNWMERPAGQSTLRYYAEHWRSRAAEFRTAEFGMTLRYEDFIVDRGLQKKLLEYLEIDQLPPDDFVKTSKVDWSTRNKAELTRWERWWARRYLRKEMQQWGYI